MYTCICRLMCADRYSIVDIFCRTFYMYCILCQVFGGLLTAKPAEGGEDETDSPAPPEGEKESAKPEDEVREHVVDFLSCQGKLSGLQKQVSASHMTLCMLYAYY